MADGPDVPAERPAATGTTTPAAVSALLARRLPGYARLVAAPAVDEAALAFPVDPLAEPDVALSVAARVAPSPRRRAHRP